MAEWFRSWHGAPSDLKLRAVARQARQKPGVATAIWWHLLDMASQSTPRGTIHGCDPEVLAEATGWSPAVVTLIIDAMVERRLVDRVANGAGTTIRVAKWDERQPAWDKSSARVRAFRDRQRGAETR